MCMKIGDYIKKNTEIETDLNDETEPLVLDINDGIERLGGSLEFYIRLSVYFLHHFKNVAYELKALMDKGSLNEARLLAHSLNGASANISAFRVRRLAILLEENLGNGDIKASFIIMEKLESALDDVFSSISSLEEQLKADGDN